MTSTIVHTSYVLIITSLIALIVLNVLFTIRFVIQQLSFLFAHHHHQQQSSSISSSYISLIPHVLLIFREQLYYCYLYTKLFVRWIRLTWIGKCVVGAVWIMIATLVNNNNNNNNTFITTIVTTVIVLSLVTLFLYYYYYCNNNNHPYNNRKRLTGVQELIDTHSYDSIEEYRENLEDMNTLSMLTGAFYSHIHSPLLGLGRFMQLNNNHPPQSILDVGCGNGTLCIQLYHWYCSLLPQQQQQQQSHESSQSSQSSKQVVICGIDMSEIAIELANEQASSTISSSTSTVSTSSTTSTISSSSLSQWCCCPSVSFKRTEQVELNEPDKSYDVVTCSLMTHHIPTDEDIVYFLRKAGQVARRAIVINDLERDTVAVIAYQLLMFPMFKNRLTRHDGLMSIRRSFTQDEWTSYLLRAGYDERQFRVNWCPVSRFIIYVDLSDHWKI